MRQHGVEPHVGDNQFHIRLAQDHPSADFAFPSHLSIAVTERQFPVLIALPLRLV